MSFFKNIPAKTFPDHLWEWDLYWASILYFWWRQFWHTLGGALLGAAISILALWIGIQIKLIVGAIFAAFMVGLEIHQRKHQSKWKTVVDPLAWMLGYLLVISFW